MYTHTDPCVSLLYMGILDVYSNLEGGADIGSYFQVKSIGYIGGYSGVYANGK